MSEKNFRVSHTGRTRDFPWELREGEELIALVKSRKVGELLIEKMQQNTAGFRPIEEIKGLEKRSGVFWFYDYDADEFFAGTWEESKKVWLVVRGVEILELDDEALIENYLAFLEQEQAKLYMEMLAERRGRSEEE